MQHTIFSMVLVFTPYMWDVYLKIKSKRQHNIKTPVQAGDIDPAIIHHRDISNITPRPGTSGG